MMLWMSRSSLLSALLLLRVASSTAFTSAPLVQPSPRISSRRQSRLRLQPPGQATELPDSLDDAAVRAAEATASFVQQAAGAGALLRCRVDFDTSAGDETYTLLKQSTEFMQAYVTALSYALVPGLLEQRQEEVASVAQAKVELQALRRKTNDGDGGAMDPAAREQREDALVELIARDGRRAARPTSTAAAAGGDANGTAAAAVAATTTATMRVYFPDEGSAALARRDWTSVVPPCVQFSSCGGVQQQDTTRDVVQCFLCPRASDSDAVEAILARSEMAENAALRITVFVNPVLVDMGVTGFGMAGRRLRERLIDGLVGIYYLRTLPWGALTRQWPAAYTIWQEDNTADSGYRLLQTLDRLPSNPEVEDVYDIANGSRSERQSGGLLDQFGDFVNGMMRL